MQLLVDTLAHLGARDFVLSPGSRSTPLVLAAAQHESLRCHDVIDERSAAFFALGQARARGQPTVLVCTSGTAPAHYLPAVIEASHANVPLMVLSADRPHELQQCGANQTIDQVKLFGDHVRHYADLGMAESDPGALRGLRRAASQAVARSLGPPAGPVHLLARARKPLEPGASELDAGGAADAEPQVPWGGPPTRAWPARPLPSEQGVRTLVQACEAARRGVLLAGPAPLEQAEVRQAAHAFARAAGLVLMAEGTSQLRFAGRAAGEVARCDGFDALYRSASGREHLAPDLVVQLGAAPVSTGMGRLLEGRPDIPRVVLTPHGWPDPHGSADALVLGEPGETLERASDALGRGPSSGAPPSDWHRSLASAESSVWEAVDAELQAMQPSLSEGAVARESLVAAGEGEGLLFVGNSLPVRQLDAWCPGNLAAVRVASQRGASGIDGLVSGAAGLARGSRGPVVAVVGDVSFLHDAGGLLTARRLDTPLALVVVNNDGGRIFEQLPLGGRADLAGSMAHFTTPHGLSVTGLAEAYGHAGVRVDTPAGLRQALASALDGPGCTVVEALVPVHAAAEQANRIHHAVEQALGARGR
jgi:2-succinyl-5-enolpyruvyl-6-hydroxy-3-cyclohexene-1-carboxylate synthase